MWQKKYLLKTSNIARFEQILRLSQCFQKTSAGEASESIYPTAYIQAMVLSNNLDFRVDNIFLIMINI